jgi:hypothetical protein
MQGQANEAVLVYVSALCAIASAIITGGFCDLMLFLGGEQTISSWLRLHPLWFVFPAGLMLIFIIGLTFHLFC